MITTCPGVAAIIFDAVGRILLHRRRVGDGWAPPSGSVEPMEDLHSALRREVWEETRLVIEKERLVGVYSNPAYQVVHYPEGRAVHFITTVFACRRREGQLEGSDEGVAWGWFEPVSLPPRLLPYASVWLEDAVAANPIVVVR